jgi:hypothetical protein
MKTLILLLAVMAAMTLAQDVTYCKNAQTGEVIVIEAGHACPFGYYRI